VDWGSAWVAESADNVKQIALASDGTNGPLLGVLLNSGLFEAKEGGLGSAWDAESADDVKR
jgi:hypothetical protein